MKHHLIGKIVTDITVDERPQYAVGRTGFLQLDLGGQFLRYDSAFSGPEFFDKPAFELAGTWSK